VPTQTTVTVDGVDLQLRTWPAAAPSAPPVVLLPGTATTAEDWDVIAAALHESRTVHAVNLRGHGPSDWPGTYSIRLMADDVAGLLRQLGGPPVDLVGHSLGGLVGCLVAAEQPALVRRLVLEDVGILQRRPAVMPPRPEGALPFDWRVVEQVRPEIDDPDPGWRDVVARIVAPTLVIGGGSTSSIPQDQVADLARTVPDGRQVTVDAGHRVHATRPAEFTNCLLAFLDS